MFLPFFYYLCAKDFHEGCINHLALCGEMTTSDKVESSFRIDIFRARNSALISLTCEVRLG